ncbi:MAG: thiamine pyrophosphate-binding protein [Candidatus Dormiibacterota bacterium]
MQVPDIVARTLISLGVRQVFGLVGSGNYTLTDALDRAGATFTPARHEGGAITMADAYARVSGELPACTVHQGPGLTNTVTGLTEAAKSRTPLLVLAAESGGARSNFRIDQSGLAQAVGALAERVQSPATAAGDCLRAVQRARLERRPVLLNLPLEVLAAAAEPSPLPSLPALLPVVPAAASIEAALVTLEQAERPLIIAGRGAVLAGAGPGLERLAERFGAVLATSAVANGLFAQNPWAIGISGGFASPLAAELISASDVVLSVGASLNMWTTSHGRLIDPQARLIQVDDEADAIGANLPVAVPVLGDAGTAVDALEQAAAGHDVQRAGWRSTALAARLEVWREEREPFEDASTADRIDPRTLSVELDRQLPLERTVATDSGGFLQWPSSYLRVPDAQGFCFTQAFQAVGLGLASAIGAAVARPDRLTVAALGDGGTLMGLPDLETVARLRLRMVIVVYNDAAYGAEVHHFDAAPGRPLVHFPDTDLAAIARGAGLVAITVRQRADLAPVAEWLRAPEQPALLVDAKIVPTVVAPFLRDAFGH